MKFFVNYVLPKLIHQINPSTSTSTGTGNNNTNNNNNGRRKRGAGYIEGGANDLFGTGGKFAKSIRY
jgi:hypothetical protein